MKIGVLTSSRADYGLLRSLIIETQKFNQNTHLMITGSHLSKEFGETIDHILNGAVQSQMQDRFLNHAAQNEI